MILARIRTRIPLLKQNILTGRGIIAAAAAPRRRAFISNSATKRYAFNMAEACDKNDASAAKEELPPLTDHEFKNYNRLAERMELFVSNIAALTYTRVMYKAHTCIYMHNHMSVVSSHTLLTAQQLPPIMEHPLASLHHRPSSSGHVHQATPQHRHRVR